MPTKREQLAEQIDLKSKEILSLFESKKAGEQEWDLTPEETKTVREGETELAKLRKEIVDEAEKERIHASAKDASEAINRPGSIPRLPNSGGAMKGLESEAESKTLGRQFIESKAFTGYDPSSKMSPEVKFETKTIVDTATAYQPQAIRTGYISQFPTRPIAVIDQIPQGTTNQIAVVYMEETTYTNAAVETAESGSYAQAAIQFTQRTATVRKIAVYVPITDELMEDAEQAESYVNNRLQFMVRQRLDSQIINGNGSGVNLQGIIGAANVQNQPRGTDSNADAIHKGITLVRSVGFAEPTACIIHPTNWETVHLMKTSTGEYIYGAPWQDGPGTMWGLPVVPTTAIASGTSLVGAFRPHCEFTLKRDLMISVGYVNDDFIKGQLSIRVDMRGALPIYRPSAFCTQTSLN